MKYLVIPVTPFQQNCTLLWCERTGAAAVVDPGGDVDIILEEIERTRVKPEKILLTHGHVDHAGGTAELKRRLGLPVEGPQREERFWLQALPQQSVMFGVAPVESFEPDRWLDEGDAVTVGNLNFQVIHCPGHTPGHIVFFEPAERIAIVGDVLFAGSIGRTDFPRGDYATLIASIREKLFPLGDDVMFLPGHGPESTFGRERRTNPFVAD